MSLFDILEGRMKQIFEGGSAMAPLPFKKLAKQAVHEMKRSAVKMDGRTFAPSLYTVLVNPADDAAIAPLYQQVTDEMVDFVAHEAQNSGLALMANPMVRFIADPNIRQGKMEVIAEVVTPDVLDALRVEETAYAQNHARTGGRGTRGGMRPGGTMRAVQQPPAMQPPQQQRPARMPQRPAANPLASGANGPDGALPPAQVAAIPAILNDDGEPQARRPSRPAAQPSETPQGRPERASDQAGRPQQRGGSADGPSTCELVEANTGRTWRIGVPSTVIGRDEATADLVLNDTNVSRKHAELRREGGVWRVVDLGSTNGTRVNGMRVTEYDLTSGDTLTMGLVTLEFKEL